MESTFRCLCSSIYLCKKHLGEHLDIPGDHKFEKLSNLGAQEKFLTSEQISELNTRIITIISAKEKISSETKEAIALIKNRSKSILCRLDILAQKYLSFLSVVEFGEDEKNELKNELDRSLIIKNLSLSLDSYIIDAYSEVNIKREKISKIERLDISNSWSVKEKMNFLVNYMDIECTNAVNILFSNDKTHAFQCKV